MKKVFLMLVIAFTGCTSNESGSKYVSEDTSTGVYEKSDSEINIIPDSDTEEKKESAVSKDSATGIETDDIKDSETDSDADSETDSDADSETESDADSETDSDADSETESETASEADSETASEPDSETDTILDSCISGLVINEIDYDMDGADNMEFIEIYNSLDCSANLDDIAVVLFNGFDMCEYKRYLLSDCLDSLAGKSFIVFGNSGVTGLLDVPNATINDGVIQNGPDAVALINVATLEVIDSFCYEGELSEVFLTGIDTPVNLMQGTISPIMDSSGQTESLGRYPDGHKTGSFSDDWFLNTPTPGGENIKFIQ